MIREVVAQFIQERAKSSEVLLKEAILLADRFEEVDKLAQALMCRRPGLSLKLAEHIAADALDIDGG